MVSSTTCIAQNKRRVKKRPIEGQSLIIQFQIVFFFLENRNVPIFLGFETPKLGQFPLNGDGWQV